MLLRLVPPAPFPTILFTLTFPTLPPSLPLPATWDAHLQLLADTHLASPPSLHALDKSVAWIALLDTVTFDLATLTVTCVFIDAVREEWPLTNRCVDLLESVIRDVNRSAVEAEHEQQQRDRESSAISSSQEDRDGTSPDEPPPSLPAPPLPKPKKRRSFIASLMASLVPSSASASPAAPPARPPTPPTPTPAPPEETLACNGLLASRFLRRRARSVLVDAFRRFVLGELGARFRVAPAGGAAPHYALWVARSTMRRAAEEMAGVIEAALQRPHAASVPEERDEDDNDRGSASSMTDGSSVHTPPDYHDAPARRRAVLAPAAYQTYVVLRALHHRLHDLACRLAAHARAQGLAAAAEAGAAEVRSRRRAWSARRYLVPGAGTGKRFGGASMALVGLAVPARPSPLCRGWTADDVERERRAEWERRVLMLRRARSSWAAQGGARHAGAAARSREAEDVEELARDVEGRLAVGAHDAGRAGYREDDDGDDDDEGEFGPGPRLPARPTLLLWSRPKLDMARVAIAKPKSVVVAAIEDNVPVSAKLPLDPDPACASDI